MHANDNEIVRLNARIHAKNIEISELKVQLESRYAEWKDQ